MSERVTSEDLYQHLQAIIRDTEALMQATASFAGDKAEQARAKAGDSLRAAKERIGNVQDDMTERAQDYLRQGQQYVRDNPWQSIGVAAGIGLLVGALLLGSLTSRRD
jgi:ElaB/YqjD/DUF883 family membrane-anchored ribosome-binding protein